MEASPYLQPRPNCPLCAGKKFKVLFAAPLDSGEVWHFLQDFYGGRPDRQRLEGGRYELRRCGRCGLVYQAQAPTEELAKELYEHWIDGQQSLDKKRFAPPSRQRKYARQCRVAAKLLRAAGSGAKVLDFGCGWGYWGRQAAEFGFAVVACDSSPARLQHARSLGLETVADARHLPESAFDYIHCEQVLEHLPQPLASLTLLARALKPGGYIHLRVPNAPAELKQLARRGWSPTLSALHPLEHLNAFSRRTLKQLARAAGLAPIQPPLMLSAANPASLFRSLRREWRDRTCETHIYCKRVR